MKVAIYTRVSTVKQDTENQAAQLREFAAKMGWTLCHELVDVAQRARKTGRSSSACSNWRRGGSST